MKLERIARRWPACLLLFFLHIALDADGANHSLWKIEGKTNATYLFGSVHLLNKKYYPLPQPIESAYTNSDTVVFEIDIDEGETAQAQVKLLQFGAYPPGKSLKTELSKEGYEKVQKHLNSKGLPEGSLDQLKPWMISVTLLMLELQKLGIEPKDGVDNYFFAKAKKDGKKIVPLETLDQQLSFFDDLDSKEDEALIHQTFEELSTYTKEFNKLLEAWKAGDTKTLETMLLDAFKDYPDLGKKLLTDRNKKWVTKLQKLHSEGKNVFVVVGAAHLVGNDSVVELLQKAGLKVIQQ